MAEYIEREAAINAVFEALADGRSAYIALEALPAADVRPVMKATWIMPNADGTDRPMPECSHCGWYVDNGGVKDFSFCPNCGASMVNENE